MNSTHRNKRHASPTGESNNAKRPKCLPVTSLKRLYGKLTTSYKKKVSFTQWRGGEKFSEIAKKLGVAEATSEVYVIDMVFEGQATPQERAQLLIDLGVFHDQFSEISEHLQQEGVSLRQIRDATGYRYNQIRAVIACIVQDNE